MCRASCFWVLVLQTILRIRDITLDTCLEWDWFVCFLVPLAPTAQASSALSALAPGVQCVSLLARIKAGGDALPILSF